MRTTIYVQWDADVAVTGESLALVLFSDRSWEYIPHTEF